MPNVTGTFEVNLTPQGQGETVEGIALGRMALDKVYSGPLGATGKGEMLTAITGVQGSAVYTAIERVTGALDGRAGTFALYHTGVMKRGAQKLVIGIVPDSGTGALAGIAGEMTIQISDGQHHYTLAYTLNGEG